jgi:hypothetical protein
MEELKVPKFEAGRGRVEVGVWGAAGKPPQTRIRLGWQEFNNSFENEAFNPHFWRDVTIISQRERGWSKSDQ